MGNRAALAVVVVGVLTASCSGGHSASTIPSAPAGRPAGAQFSPMGARSTRAKASIAAPPGWAATATGAIVPANASDLGALDAGKPVEVVLGLQIRNVDAVKASVAAGQKMSHDAFVSQFAPSADQVAAAVSYLKAQGFSGIAVARTTSSSPRPRPRRPSRRRSIRQLHTFSVAGGRYYANTRPRSSRRARRQRRRGARAHQRPGFEAASAREARSRCGQARRVRAGGAPQANGCTKGVDQTTGAPVCPRFYDPATFNVTYDAGSTPPADNTKIAIFTEGDTSAAVTDLRENETQFGMPQVNVLVVNARPSRLTRRAIPSGRST